MANKFWVGGTGNWNQTARWSNSSGGAGGATLPVAGDWVFFDTNSGTGTVTANQNINIAVFAGNSANITFDLSTYTLTITGSGLNTQSTHFLGGSGVVTFTGSDQAVATRSGTNIGTVNFTNTTFGSIASLGYQINITNVNVQTNFFRVFTTTIQNLTITNPGTSYYTIIASSTYNIAGNFSAQNVVFYNSSNIVAGGTHSVTGRWGRVGTADGTAASTRYWVGNSGALNQTAKWSLTSGGAGGATLPLPQDNVVFNAASFSTTSTVTGFADESGMVLGKVSTVGTTSAHTLQSFIATDDITLSSLTTLSGSFVLHNAATNELSFTTNGANTSGVSMTVPSVYGSPFLLLQQNTSVTTLLSVKLKNNGYNLTASGDITFNSSFNNLLTGGAVISAASFAVYNSFNNSDIILRCTGTGGNITISGAYFFAKGLEFMADNYTFTSSGSVQIRIGTLYIQRAGSSGVKFSPTLTSTFIHVDTIRGGGSQAAGNLVLGSTSPGTRVKIKVWKESHLDYVTLSDFEVFNQTVYMGNYSSNASNNAGKLTWSSATNLTYVASYNSMSDLATYNFGGSMLGTASKNRYIIVMFASRKAGTSGTHVGVTIAGQAATILQTAATTSDGNNQITGIAIVRDDTTTSGTVSVQYSEAFLQCNIQIVTANNLDLTKVTSGSGTGATSSATIDVTYGGLTVGSAFNFDSTPTISWTDNDTPIRMRAVAQSTGWSEAGTHGSARAIPTGLGTSVQYMASSSNAVQMMAVAHLPYKKRNTNNDFFALFYP